MSTPRLLPRLFRLPRQNLTTQRTHFSTTRAHFNNNTAAPPPPPPPKPSLSARLKHLSKEYGYSALGVYLALSALDFPFCFLAVRTIGSERIGEYEEAVVARVRGWYAAARSTVGGAGGGGVLPEWKGKETTELQEAREKRQSASEFYHLARMRGWVVDGE
jgi:hypothetical protein